jgi:hypothetical protein
MNTNITMTHEEELELNVETQEVGETVLSVDALICYGIIMMGD